MMTKSRDGLYAHVPFHTPTDAVAAINNADELVSVEVGEVRSRLEKGALVTYLNSIPRPYGIVIVRPLNPPKGEHRATD
jgi:hypothetical protein